MASKRFGLETIWNRNDSESKWPHNGSESKPFRNDSESKSLRNDFESKRLGIETGLKRLGIETASIGFGIETTRNRNRFETIRDRNGSESRPPRNDLDSEPKPSRNRNRLGTASISPAPIRFRFPRCVERSEAEPSGSIPRNSKHLRRWFARGFCSSFAVVAVRAACDDRADELLTFVGRRWLAVVALCRATRLVHGRRRFDRTRRPGIGSNGANSAFRTPSDRPGNVRDWDLGARSSTSPSGNVFRLTVCSDSDSTSEGAIGRCDAAVSRSCPPTTSPYSGVFVSGTRSRTAKRSDSDAGLETGTQRRTRTGTGTRDLNVVPLEAVSPPPVRMTVCRAVHRRVLLELRVSA